MNKVLAIIGIIGIIVVCASTGMMVGIACYMIYDLIVESAFILYSVFGVCWIVILVLTDTLFVCLSGLCIGLVYRGAFK